MVINIYDKPSNRHTSGHGIARVRIEINLVIDRRKIFYFTAEVWSVPLQRVIISKNPFKAVLRLLEVCAADAERYHDHLNDRQMERVIAGQASIDKLYAGRKGNIV